MASGATALCQVRGGRQRAAACVAGGSRAASPRLRPGHRCSPALPPLAEFSFLDARGVGELERLPVGEVAAALAAGDALAATWRPGPNVDGTVHESSADVVVRGRQLLSLLETQYVGSDVIIVSPDSDNLSALQAAVLGVDLRQHHTLAFAPGEARRLQLSAEQRPEAPSSWACPRPPQCT